MKAIKFTPAKNRIFISLLIFSILLTGTLLFALNVDKKELDQYDVMTSCESVPVPFFSVPEGIYDKPFTLEIQAPDGYAIHYTTDGSIPTVHSRRYKKSITIHPYKNRNKDLVSISTSLAWFQPYGQQKHVVPIRARCFKDGVGYGKVKNVIYSTPNISQHIGFQVVHILMESDSLFSQERGVYVLGKKYYSNKTRAATFSLEGKPWFAYPGNFSESGKNWRRPAEFILMDLSGKTLFEQSVKLGLHGNISRALPQKSIRIMADSLIGNAVIHYPLFNELPVDRFKNILLRGYSDDNVMFRDVLVQQMAKCIGLNIQEFNPVVVYINGNYWGIHNIREKIDANYFASRYSSSLDRIDILVYENKKMNLQFGKEQSLQSFNELIDFIMENSLADEKAYQAVCSQMDIDNFIDYMIVETFFANNDWLDNNIRSYKIEYPTGSMTEQNVEIGKWKWQVFDFDNAIELPPSTNMFERIKNDFAEHLISPLFFGLMENSEFKEKFLTRYKFVIQHYFNSEKLLKQIDIFEKQYQNEIVRQIARWRRPLLEQVWRKHIRTMRDFVKERPDYVLNQLKTI